MAPSPSGALLTAPLSEWDFENESSLGLGVRTLRRTGDGVDFSSRKTLTDESGNTAAFAAHPNGHAIVWWQSSDRIARRAPGKAYGPVRALDGVSGPNALAVNGHGGAAVSWNGPGGLYVRTAKPGRSFGARRTVLRVRRAYIDTQALALDDAGRATLVWTRTNGAVTQIFVSRSTRYGRFGPVRMLARLPNEGGRGAQLFARSVGATTMVFWHDRNPGSARGIEVATFEGAGKARTTEVPGTTGGRINDFDMLPDGRAAIAFTGAEANLSRVSVTLRSVRGRWSPSVNVSGDGRFGDPSVALDPRTGEPTVVYASLSEYTVNDFADETYTLLSRTRTR